MHLSRIQEYGLSNGDCQKLADAGFHTIESIAFTPRKQLISVRPADHSPDTPTNLRCMLFYRSKASVKERQTRFFWPVRACYRERNVQLPDQQLTSFRIL